MWYSALLAFLGCAVIGISQGDERLLMSKFSYCGCMRSCKESIPIGSDLFVYPAYTLSSTAGNQ